MNQRPDMDDLPHTEWTCKECHATNSCLDAECQFCDTATPLEEFLCEKLGTCSCQQGEPQACTELAKALEAYFHIEEKV